MKSNNNTQDKLRQDKENECAVISAIFTCKLRKAIISVLTEWAAAPLRRSLNRADTRQILAGK